MPDAFNPYHKWLGIPPEQQPADHYRLLALAQFESDPDVIEGAADRQMAHIRTFQAGPHSALSQQILNELSVARLCLLTPNRKAAYDADLHRRLDAAQRPTPIAVLPLPTLPAPVLPAAPVLPVASAFVRTDTPLIVTEGGASRHLTRRRRPGAGRAVAAWLMLAAVAIPATVFVGYLIRAKRQSEEVARGGRPEAGQTPKKPEATPAPKGPGPVDSSGPRRRAPQTPSQTHPRREAQPNGSSPEGRPGQKEEQPFPAQADDARPPSRGQLAQPPATPPPPETVSGNRPPELPSLAELLDKDKPSDAKSAPGKATAPRSKSGRQDRRRKGPASGSTSFLCELTLQDWFVFVPRKGAVTVLAPGIRFDNGGALRVNNQPTPHGIFAPPPAFDASRLSFALNRKAKSVSFEVGIDDGAANFLATQPVFQVYGDNKLLWTSAALRGKGHTEKCTNLNVDGVKVLVLRVNCPGKREGTETVWVEPTVTWK